MLRGGAKLVAHEIIMVINALVLAHQVGVRSPPGRGAFTKSHLRGSTELQESDSSKFLSIREKLLLQDKAWMLRLAPCTTTVSAYSSKTFNASSHSADGDHRDINWKGHPQSEARRWLCAQTAKAGKRALRARRALSGPGRALPSAV